MDIRTGETKMKDMFGFLHRHPKMEAEHNIDKEHVIVDRDEWEQFRNGQVSAEHDRKKADKLLHVLTAIAIKLEQGNDIEFGSEIHFMVNEVLNNKTYTDEVKV